jgi:hypothetical protein
MTGEDTVDWEDLECALVICGVPRLVKILLSVCSNA